MRVLRWLNPRNWGAWLGRWMCVHGLHAWDTWIGNPHGRMVVTKRWCARKGCEAMLISYWP